MALFIDTANLEEVKKYMSWGIISGITTNPKIFSEEEGIDYKQRIHDLMQFHLPVSIELTKTHDWSVEELFKEGFDYMNEFGQNIVVKVPMWKDGKGLEVAKKLIANAVKVNMTCLMNVEQVILACELGCTYASLFYNRIIDYFTDWIWKGQETAQRIVKGSSDVTVKYGHKTKLICGSIRVPQDVSECLLAGADIVTVTPKVLEQLPFHLKTEETIAEFDQAWKTWKEQK